MEDAVPPQFAGDIDGVSTRYLAPERSDESYMSPSAMSWHSQKGKLLRSLFVFLHGLGFECGVVVID
jgi:hypothetical protein